MTISKLTPYSDQYKTACFQAWYAAGKPTRADILAEVLPEDEYKRKPSMDVLRSWKKEDGWDIRASVLDERVEKQIDDSLVADKVEILKRQGKEAKIIQERAMEFLEVEGFDSSASAVNAYMKGAELERMSVGLTDALLKLAKLTNDELTLETKKLLEKFVESGETIIDVAEIPQEETEDAESDE